MSSSYVLSSEYVSPGHPDKVADQISDAVLDTYLALDPTAKVACETLVKDNRVIVAGEVRSAAQVSKQKLEEVIRRTVCDIGYNDDALGFNGNSCEITHLISDQSQEIHEAVVADEKIGAGDQGIMFGYATRETPTMMPPAIYLAKKIIDTAYKNPSFRQSLRPDMKSQISLRYRDGRPAAVESVVFSTCHREGLDVSDVRDLFHGEIKPLLLSELPSHLSDLFVETTEFHINPAGNWNIGGPVSDCGLTGRKIVVDQYGADCEIGGGAFSGKDPSKVDRSAAYMARYIARQALKHNPDITAAKVQLAYAIGKPEPVSLRVFDPQGRREISGEWLSEIDTTPRGIIDKFNLYSPIYLRTAREGHFGCSPEEVDGLLYFPWEA